MQLAPYTNPESALELPARDAEPTMTPTPVNPLPLQPAKLPPPPTMATRRQRGLPGSNSENNRIFSTSLAGILHQQPIRPLPPSEIQSHTDSKPTNDVHQWDVLYGLHPPDSALSDTSSVSEDMAVSGVTKEPSWDPDTGRWETYADNSAWSDSDGTSEDVQTSKGSHSLHFNNKAQARSTIFAPQPYPSVNEVLVPLMAEKKHPRPKINERCRKWLRNECALGYECNFVHEDLEYDDPPVSLHLSLHKHFFILAF